MTEETAVRITERMNRNFFIKLLVWAVLFLLLYTVTIQYQVVCELGGSWRTPVSLKTPVDAYTPVNIYIMWFYAACLLYVPFSGALFALNRRITAIQVVAFYLGVIAVYLLSYAIYLVFPTTAAEVMLTSYEPNKDLFINRGMFDALQNLYALSTPLGDFPSLHVAPLVVMGLFLWRYWRWLLVVYVPLAFLGGVGTFVLKFHTVMGFLGGAVMGVFGWLVIFSWLLRVLSRFEQSADAVAG